ncbi:MAG TPA: prenyltransferase [Clostridia bacterium]|nr:prenyltransferase [Clostridia bacterium]
MGLTEKLLKAKMKLKGIVCLIRIIPLMSWGICGVILGGSIAVKKVGFSAVIIAKILLFCLTVLLIQGILAHAINEYEDWLSGTDIVNGARFSGGSKVIKRGMLTLKDLLGLAKISTFLSLTICLLSSFFFDYWVWLVIGLGIAASYAYTYPPLRMAYRPFLGEWLVAWPAVLLTVLGSHYLLANSLDRTVLVAGVIHSTFCISWLMQHHLSDIPADLAANPPKLTTVAFIRKAFGLAKAKVVVIIYSALAMILGLIAIFKINPLFLVSFLLALVCLALALTTNPANLEDIESKEIGMVIITILHAALLAALNNLV